MAVSTESRPLAFFTGEDSSARSTSRSSGRAPSSKSSKTNVSSLMALGTPGLWIDPLALT